VHVGAALLQRGRHADAQVVEPELASDHDTVVELYVHWADPLLPQPLVGAQAVLDFTLTNFHTFPDLVCEIPEPPYLSEDGKRAVFYWRLSGTMKGALPNGVPATGKFVSVEGMDRWEFRDGRICRYRAFYDVMDLLKQCGLMPA